MSTTTSTLLIKGFGKRKMTEIAAKAKRLGMTPERYVKQLVDEDLALDREARTIRLAGFFSSGQEIDEAELDRVVEKARQEHHQRSSRKRR
jgi:hypothetical protein